MTEPWEDSMAMLARLAPIDGPPVPAYYRLQETLRKKIEEMRWRPGEAIPSERLIAEEYGLSVGTVKKALGNLVYEGYLFRVQGKGTFVSGTTLRRGSLRYYRMMESFADEEADLRVSLLGISLIEGFEPACSLLGLPVKRRLFELRRLFLSGDVPMVYSVSYMPESLFSGLDAFPPALFEKGTLYEAIEKHYGLPCIYNRELLSAAQAPADVAKILKLQPKGPLISIEMIAYTYKDMPYEYRLSWCATNRRRIYREID
ncbi:MAG: GntR family transcriptional regulator [Spirochaetes bacterium]|jgi:GntR family transcriptional regulator|nr:GntR family transcriptional regulator [Spirochaetota bacterium]